MKRSFSFFVLAALSAAVPASGYIEAIYPLQQVINESTVIAEGVIEKSDPEKKIATVKITKSIKGKCHYEHIRMNFGGGQFYFPEVIMRHMAVGSPAVVFYNDGRQGEIYINRFFNQIYGDAGAPPDKAWWNFTHVEIRMNRTYNGTAEELSKLVSDIQAGKAKAPAPIAKLPPISKETLVALPPWGQPVDVEKLPAPWTKPDPNRLKKFRDPENPANATQGLNFAYYEGAWNELPDFNALKPAATGTAAEFDLSKRKRDDQFGLKLTGFIHIPKEGVYNFYTLSDDGSKLYIGNVEVTANDGLHPPLESVGDIALKAGKHAITVTFFENGGGEYLEVFWEGPDLPKAKIPAATLFRTP